MKKDKIIKSEEKRILKPIFKQSDFAQSKKIELNEEEQEDIEIENIRKSGKKKIITEEEYGEKFDPQFCRYCMNYIDETDSCKKGLPDPAHTKDEDGFYIDCEEYDFIYITDEEKDN